MKQMKKNMAMSFGCLMMAGMLGYVYEPALKNWMADTSREWSRGA